MIAIGVTGTATGTGKTTVAGAMLALLRRRGLHAAAMKPVQTGSALSMDADGAFLRAIAESGDDLADVSPVVLPDLLVPWAAAKRAGDTIETSVLDAAFRRLADGRDAIVIEETGGLVAPITRHLAWDGLWVAWELDLVVVAGPSEVAQTLLVTRAAHEAGLRVRGVVQNQVRAGTADMVEAHAEVLRELLAPVPLFQLPHLAEPRSPDALADAAEAAGLDELLRERVAPR